MQDDDAYDAWAASQKVYCRDCTHFSDGIIPGHFTRYPPHCDNQDCFVDTPIAPNGKRDKDFDTLNAENNCKLFELKAK